MSFLERRKTESSDGGGIETIEPWKILCSHLLAVGLLIWVPGTLAGWP